MSKTLKTLVKIVFVGFLFVTLIFAGCKKEKEKISITGSTTVLPIAQKCAEVYMKTKETNVRITINGGGSGVGIAALIDGRTDIADASRKIKDKELKIAKEKGINPVGTVVAKDALAIVVNPNVTLSEISIDSLKAIYKGDIKNWKVLGGPDAEIVVVSRDTSSGTFETFEKKVMNKEKVINEALMVASNKAVSQTISKTPNSIGYIGLGYISDQVKVLTVEGVGPSIKTVNNATYKISRSLYMYTNGSPKGAVKNFIDFILTKEGQKLVNEVGYVPLK